MKFFRYLILIAIAAMVSLACTEDPLGTPPADKEPTEDGSGNGQPGDNGNEGTGDNENTGGENGDTDTGGGETDETEPVIEYTFTEVSKEGWEIAFCNTEQGEWGAANKCIDGDNTSSWHTYYTYPEAAWGYKYDGLEDNQVAADDFVYGDIATGEDTRFNSRSYYYPSCWAKRKLEHACVVIDMGKEVEFQAVMFDKYGYDTTTEGNGDRSLKKCKVLIADNFSVIPIREVDANWFKTSGTDGGEVVRPDWQLRHNEYTLVSNSENGGWTEAFDCYLEGGWEPEHIKQHIFHNPDDNRTFRARYIKLNPYETYNPGNDLSVVINEFSVMTAVIKSEQ